MLRLENILFSSQLPAGLSYANHAPANLEVICLEDGILFGKHLWDAELALLWIYGWYLVFLFFSFFFILPFPLASVTFKNKVSFPWNFWDFQEVRSRMKQWQIKQPETQPTLSVLGLIISLYIMCMCACLHVCMCTVCLEIWEATRKCQTPWN